jgi:hypothetical protein
MCGRAFCYGTRLTESGNYPFKMNKIILTACYMKAHECLHVGTGVSDIKNTNFVQARILFRKITYVLAGKYFFCKNYNLSIQTIKKIWTQIHNEVIL